MINAELNKQWTVQIWLYSGENSELNLIYFKPDGFTSLEQIS